MIIKHGPGESLKTKFEQSCVRCFFNESNFSIVNVSYEIIICDISNRPECL